MIKILSCKWFDNKVLIVASNIMVFRHPVLYHRQKSNKIIKLYKFIMKVSVVLPCNTHLEFIKMIIREESAIKRHVQSMRCHLPWFAIFKSSIL